MDRDRNLLFGVFAVQLNKVSAIQLMEAAGAWAVEPSKGIPERLVAARALSQGDRDLIQRFVDEAVAAHDGNAGQTLKSFGGDAQVHRSYRGSIVLTPDGQVSIPPTDVTPHGSTGSKSDPDIGSIKGVFETPGRYTNAIEHARGGMGRVLLVHDDYLGRDIALKELLPHLGEVEEATTRDRNAVSTEDGPPSPVRFSAHILARFLQEARITGQLEHPSIVPVYELGHRADGSLYYTMKLVRGRSLSKALGECKTLEERLRYLPHFVDLCQAIAYAHSRKIIHRDIKPANVMVGEFGETVVLDWGLAKRRDREDVHQKALAETILAMNLSGEFEAARTAYGQVLGTPVYMPPEQAKGDLDEVDEQSDVYSLGAVLYEILTGKLPFEGKSTREVLNKVIAGDAVPVSAHIEGAPPELVAIAAKAMRKEKERRYADVKALAEEVQRFQSGALVGAYTYTLRELFRRYTVRHKALVVGSACAAVALLALFSISYWRIAIERDQAQLARQAEAEALKVSEEKVTELVRASYVSSIRLAESHVSNRQPNLARQRLLEAPAELRDWEWGNLFLSLDSSRRTFTGHSDPVIFGTWSPDGKFIVTASLDNTAKIWDAETGAELRTLAGHTDGLSSASWSPSGMFVATTSDDMTVKVWAAETATELRTLTALNHRPRNVSWSPDGRYLITAGSENSIKVWGAESGLEIRSWSLEGHSGEFPSISWSPDGQNVVTTSEDKFAKVWNIDTGLELRTLAGHDDPVYSAAWSPNGQHILTRSMNSAKIWDAVSGTELRTFAGDTYGTSWSPDGHHVVGVLSDRIAKIWEAETGVERAILAGHNLPVLSTSWSPDGRYVLTTSMDKTAKIWDAAIGEAQRTLAGYKLPTRDPSWSPDSRRLVGSSNSASTIWDAETGTKLQSLTGHDGLVYSAVWSPVGDRIVTASQDRTAKIWDAESGALLQTLAGHEDRVSSAVWGPDGHRIFTRSWDNTARMWDAETGQELFRLSGGCSVASWSPGGEYVLTYGSDDKIKVFVSDTGSELWTQEGHTEDIWSVSWSPAGHRIVTASGDARIWDAESGAILRILVGHNLPVSSASWSPDGQYILTTSWDLTAKVWDAETGIELRTLAGHAYPLFSASWSPDGLRIATASRDRTAKVWDSETGAELRTLIGHDSVVYSATWSPDGNKLLTTSADAIPSRVWNSAPWSPDAKHSQELVDLALRGPSNDHKTGLGLGNVDKSLATIEAMFLNWSKLDSAVSSSIAETPGIGIGIDDPADIQVVDGIALEKNDLIVRVNSMRVDTMRSAAEIGQSILRRYREAPDSAVSIRFDIVRNYGLETYSLILPGASK